MIHDSYMYNAIQYYGSHFNGIRLRIKHSCKGVDMHKKLGNLDKFECHTKQIHCTAQ